MTKKTEKVPAGKALSLGVKDRLFIPNLFPEKDVYVNLIIAKHIEKKVQFTSEELDELKIRPDGKGGIVWDFEKEKAKGVLLTESEVNFLKERVSFLSESKELSYHMVDTIEKIME